MIRTLALVVALALPLFSPRTEAAQIPLTDVVLTGTLVVESTVPGQNPTKVALSKKQLLAYFGFPQVDPASVIFTIDADTAPYINIGIAAKDTLGGYGGLITYNNNGQFVINNADNTSFTQYGSANLLNEQFAGSIALTGRTVTTKKRVTQTFSFTFAGTGSTKAESSPNAILRGTFRGTFTQPNQP